MAPILHALPDPACKLQCARNYRVALALSVTLICIFGARVANAQATKPKATPAPVVIVETVKLHEVRKRQEFSGRVEAMKRIELHARVKGFLKRRAFDEGGDVNAGDLLFEIEPDSYQISVAEAEAGVVSALAAQREAQDSFDRTQVLQKTNTLSRASLEAARTRLTQARSAANVAKAKMRQAKLNLGYARIIAPIDGRIGRTAHAVGDLVGPSSPPLATLVSQDPMYIAFPVPQPLLTKLQSSSPPHGPNAKQVELKLADGKAYPQKGRLAFIATQAAASTDTVIVRATIANPQHSLIDGQLVDVFLIDETPKKLLQISQSSLLLDQQGSYVFIVNANQKVEKRRVKLGKQYGANVAILSGLSTGERVIISGHHRVRVGIAVAPKINTASSTAQSAQTAN